MRQLIKHTTFTRRSLISHQVSKSSNSRNKPRRIILSHIDIMILLHSLHVTSSLTAYMSSLKTIFTSNLSTAKTILTSNLSHELRSSIIFSGNSLIRTSRHSLTEKLRLGIHKSTKKRNETLRSRLVNITFRT